MSARVGPVAPPIGSTPVKTLVIGTGGREHALALALALDPAVTEVHAAPGNPGIGAVATLHDVDPMDGSAVAALAASVDGQGTVHAGMPGDLIALDADPLASTDPRASGDGATAEQARRLRAMSPALTVIDGRVAHTTL